MFGSPLPRVASAAMSAPAPASCAARRCTTATPRPVRASCRSRLGDAGPVRRHPRRASRSSAPRRRLRRLPHGRDRDCGPQARPVPPAPPVQRRAPHPRGRSAVRARPARGRRDRRRPVHVPAGRAAFLTVTNAANHRRTWRGSSVERGLRRRRHRSVRTTSRCSRCRGRRRADRGESDRRPPAPRFHCCRGPVAGVPMLVAGTGLHRRGRRRAARRRPTASATVWDALVEAGVEPVGLGARDSCAGGQLSPSTATTWTRPATRSTRGLGLGVQGGRGTRRRDAACAPCARPARSEARRVRMTGPGIARQATRRHRPARRGDERHDVAEPGRRDRHGVRARRHAAQPGTAARDRRAWQVRGAEARPKPLYKKET